MRLLFAIGILLLPSAALAADVQEDTKDKKVIMVNGKKFFSLRDARRYSGGVKPIPTPTGKQFRQPVVRNYSYPAPVAASKKDTVTTPVSAVAPVPPAIFPDNKSGRAGENSGAHSAILDIFAPDSKP